MLKILEICCHGYDLITTPERSTRIHDSTNSETATEWFSLNYNHALKLQPKVKVHINYWLLFCKHNGTLKYH